MFHLKCDEKKTGKNREHEYMGEEWKYMGKQIKPQSELYKKLYIYIKKKKKEVYSFSLSFLVQLMSVTKSDNKWWC